MNLEDRLRDSLNDLARRYPLDPSLAANVTAQLPERDPSSHLRSPLVFATAIAGAAVVIVLVALKLLPSGNLPIGPEATPAASAASREELDAALESAIDALLASGGAEGVQLGYIGDHLSGAVWFDFRPNGDVAVVQRVDVDVTQTGWWLNPTNSPPATGRRIATTAWVLAGDAFYEATFMNGEPDDGWSVEGPDAAPRGPLALGIAMLTAEDLSMGRPADDAAVTYAPSADGGSVWTATAPHQDGSAVQTWHIGPGGELASWSFELVGVSAPLDVDTIPVTSGRVEFTPLADPGPIEGPDPEAPPDLDLFNLPEDFPLGEG